MDVINYYSVTTGGFNSSNTQSSSLLAFKFSRKLMNGQGPAGVKTCGLWPMGERATLPPAQSRISAIFPEGALRLGRHEERPISKLCAHTLCPENFTQAFVLEAGHS